MLIVSFTGALVAQQSAPQQATTKTAPRADKDKKEKKHHHHHRHHRETPGKK